MSLLDQVYNPETLSLWEQWADESLFVICTALLCVELIRYGVKKRFSWNLLGDVLTNYCTLFMFIGITFVIAGAYVGLFYLVYEYFSITQLPITGWTILLALVLADLAYYWEHRFTHRVGLAWATHRVHHSSPHFNISVAYRFGPLDALFPLFFYLPLVAMGFHPLLVFFTEKLVQLYQTALHTETVGKFPKPIEALMNTPSHHRVHHGSNPEYLDKNYGGIFIIWDRMFGTFSEEQAQVRYGLMTPINTLNPIKVFFLGYVRLFQKIAAVPTFSNAMGYLWCPPDWQPASIEPQASERAPLADGEKETEGEAK